MDFPSSYACQSEHCTIAALLNFVNGERTFILYPELTLIKRVGLDTSPHGYSDTTLSLGTSDRRWLKSTGFRLVSRVVFDAVDEHFLGSRSIPQELYKCIRTPSDHLSLVMRCDESDFCEPFRTVRGSWCNTWNPNRPLINFEYLMYRHPHGSTEKVIGWRPPRNPTPGEPDEEEMLVGSWKPWKEDLWVEQRDDEE